MNMRKLPSHDQIKADLSNKHNPKRPKVTSIFLETQPHRYGVPTTYVPWYTLKNEDVVKDGVNYFSLYKLYMEMEDTTEYEFASRYLIDWQHWVMLTNQEWFKPYVERWREELSLKLEARYLEQLKIAAMGEGREALQANKYLLERSKKLETSAGKRGRPSKQAIKQEAVNYLHSEKRILEDFKRITAKPEFSN
jgi:hypothetical protein